MAALLALSAPAAAQERPPVDRQNLLEIARVLGESHALSRACSGENDFTWYDRMKQLLAVEAPDEAFKTRLIVSFNTGFAAGQSGFAVCDDRALAEARALASRGEALARALAR
jgi:uncharacterized protein (TIGR02301 family)